MFAILPPIELTFLRGMEIFEVLRYFSKLNLDLDKSLHIANNPANIQNGVGE